MFLEDQLLLPVPVLTWYLIGLASLDFRAKYIVKIECKIIDEYVIYESAITAGFVVINRA